MPFTPEKFGQYDLMRRIARGGMAEIFLAIERGIEGVNRNVVVKRILPQMSESRDFITMFMDEARVAARLSHPNIAHIYNFGEVDGVYFLTMEFVEGLTVSKLIRQNQLTGVSVEMALRIITDVCAGLHHAHEQRDEHGQQLNIVHRDVSPQNIMISKNGVAKLLDFGIAKASSAAHVTAVGQLKGKLSYMSPEQFKNRTLDRRTDVFAAGVVLYELIRGQKLFHRGMEAATMHALLHEDAPALGPERAPPEVDAIIQLATAKQPDARFPTAAAMENVIEELVSARGMAVTSHGLARYVAQQIEVAKSLRSSTREPVDMHSATPASLGLVQNVADRSSSPIPSYPLTPSGTSMPSDQSISSLPHDEESTIPSAVSFQHAQIHQAGFNGLAAESSSPSFPSDSSVAAGFVQTRQTAVQSSGFKIAVVAVVGLCLVVGFAGAIALGYSIIGQEQGTPTSGGEQVSNNSALNASVPATVPEPITDAATPQPTAASPARVRVSLEGVPSGATIRLDDNEMESSVFDLEANGHEHTVVIEADGFERWTHAFIPTEDSVIEVEARPRRRKGGRHADRPTSSRGHRSGAKTKRAGSRSDAILVRDPGY